MNVLSQHTPYRVVWNSDWPLECYAFSHVNPPNLNLSRWHIDVNGNGNGSMSAYDGGMLMIWDESLGLYPKITSDGVLNGGLPQVAIRNGSFLSAHEAKLRLDIANGQRTAFGPLFRNFSGLGVLDWEAWPFAWSRFALGGWTPLNSAYMNASIQLVLKEHPGLPPDKADTLAGMQWDAAVKALVLSTLKVLNAERPHGKYGFFGYPDCATYRHTAPAGSAQGCDARFHQMNTNDLGWLWDGVSALFPQIYLPHPPGSYPREHPPHNVSYESNQAWVDAQVAEAMQMSRAGSGRPPVFPYGKLFYDTLRPDVLHNASGVLLPPDLASTISRPAAHGAAGMVIWGRSDDCYVLKNSTVDPVATVQLCDAQAVFIKDRLGPLTARTVESRAECAAKTCGGRGRCVDLDSQGRSLPKSECAPW